MSGSKVRNWTRSEFRIPPELRCVEMPMTRVTTGCVYIMSQPDERLYLLQREQQSVGIILGLAGETIKGMCDYINRGDVGTTPAD